MDDCEGVRRLWVSREGQQTTSGMDIPDYAYKRMAQCMLPMIQRYYESEEGQEELKEWKKKTNRIQEEK